MSSFIFSLTLFSLYLLSLILLFIFIWPLSIFISDICQSILAALPRVPLMMSHWSIHPSLSPTPAPCSPYSPTAWTSSTKVRAPYLWATSHISLSGEISPIQNKDRFLVSNGCEIHEINLISSTFRDYTKIQKFLIFILNHNLNKFYT